MSDPRDVSPGGWNAAGRRRVRTLYVIAAAGLAALVPLILFAGLWIRAELQKSQRDVDMFLGGRASALSQGIDGEIREQLAALRALSALPSFDVGTAEFEAAARRITASMPHWSALTLVRPDGEIVFTTADDRSFRSAPERLSQVRARRAPAVEVRGIAPGERGLVDLYVPVLRGDAADLVLVTSFDLRDIQGIALTHASQNGLICAVVDAGGRIIARSLSPETTVGQEAGPAYRDGTAGRTAGLYRASSREGEPLYTAFNRSDLTDWTYAVSMNRRQIDQMSTRSVWATIAAGALSLVLAGILAVFIVHTVMERRVADERLAASRALGELDARLLATTQDALDEQRKAASEREVLLREIYHRVKNNLQIVQSLLRLGSRDLRPDQRDPFESAVRRIGAMARVHTLLYNSPDLASIDFKDYLDELLRELSEGFAAEERNISSVLNAKAMRMPLDTAVPLAFIAVEILTNAFKHAFPEGRPGRITVEVAREGDDAVLTIRDDGVGMSAEQPGRRRLGLTIVRKLVEQIGGRLQEPSPGQSTFVIRFPLAELDEAEERGRPLEPAST